MKKDSATFPLTGKLTLLLMITLLSYNFTFSQQKKETCECAKSDFNKQTKADTVYHLSNGKSIVLCGYFEPESKKREFSEFTLTVCGQKKIIDFWEAVKTCRIQVKKDTLLVQLLKDLPYGKNFKFRPTIWTTEKIYFSGQKTMRKLDVNRQIPKYTQAEIATVLNSFEQTKPGLNEKTETLTFQLFVATISGSQKARQYLKMVNTKFGTFDGSYLEEYIDLTEMLALWDKK